MDRLDEVSARTLLAHAPAPPTTRDWDALPAAERAVWLRYAATLDRAQAQWHLVAARHELAEALKKPPDPGCERDPEELAMIRVQALAHYARHLEGCATVPCTCGLTELIGPGFG